MRIIIAILLLLSLSACNPAKYVGEGDYLLDKVKVKVDCKTVNSSELKRYVKQKPNTRIFDAFRFNLRVYNLSGRKDKWINNFLRSRGEAPVIFDEFHYANSINSLKSYMAMRGYRDASVEAVIDTVSARRIRLKYLVSCGQPHLIGDLSYSSNNDTIQEILKNSMNHSMLKEGSRFDIEMHDKERARLAYLMQSKGYYDFIKSDVKFMVDTTLGRDKIHDSLVISVRKDETQNNLQEYRVRNIKVYPNYTLTVNGSRYLQTAIVDSSKLGCYHFYYGSEVRIKEETLLGRISIRPWGSYDITKVENTRFALSQLKQVNVVKIDFEKVGEGLIDCIISLSLNSQQSYMVDLEGTNSSGNIGGALKLSYVHRNVFKGAEQLTSSLRLSREARAMKQGFSGNYADEVGVRTELEYPHFLLPILGRVLRDKIKSRTVVELSYDWQLQPDYKRTIITGSFGYRWRRNALWSHQYKLIDLNYINIHSISRELQENIANSYLFYSYQDHLISAGGYTVTFNNQGVRGVTSPTFFMANIEMAGNVLLGVSKVLDNEKLGDSYKVANIPFAQYVKFDLKLSYNKYINHANNLVFRIGGGIGIPYGNSEVLPFERRYFAGGANDVRGWNVRALGPGSYSFSDFNYYNQTGDIQLQGNVEYRYHLIGVIEGALFLDAGNVWTLRKYPEQPGGDFEFNNFYKQIALSWGTGLRLDFDYVVLRFDLGVKLHNPALAGGNKFRFKQLTYNDDLAFHFAIGYPF